MLTSRLKAPPHALTFHVLPFPASSAARGVVGSFPDGQSALNLAAARLRHIAGIAWSPKRYLNIELRKDPST